MFLSCKQDYSKTYYLYILTESISLFLSGKQDYSKTYYDTAQPLTEVYAVFATFSNFCTKASSMEPMLSYTTS